jgi:DcuC family C4-dicarboxylate transporter
MAGPLFGTLVIALAVYAIYRRVDVRLALLLAALALGALAGDMPAIMRTFLDTFSNEKFLVPICTAMGFAYVLRHTGCDQHLVHLLVKPLRRVKPLLIPGTILVGFLVNMPIVSQTSTAVSIGPVVIPILLAARISPATVGAALLLGCSIGGELLNPGAPELRTVVVESKKAAEKLGQAPLDIDYSACVDRLLPLNLIGLFTATGVFWWLASRIERKQAALPELGNKADDRSAPVPLGGQISESVRPALAPPVGRISESVRTDSEIRPTEPLPELRVNLLRALVPLVPILLLYLSTPLFHREGLFPELQAFLEDLAPPDSLESGRIGAAMLLGALAAVLAVPRTLPGSAGAFFEGAGFGFTNIIALIIVANCFGKGIELLGFAKALGEVIQQAPGLLLPLACFLSLGFGILSGSGMATTQSIFPFFAEPSLQHGIDPAHVGSVVALAAAAGRTMSPVAAVCLMSATLTKTDPFTLVRRTALPLLAGVLAFLAAAILMAPGY